MGSWGTTATISEPLHFTSTPHQAVKNQKWANPDQQQGGGSSFDSAEPVFSKPPPRSPPAYSVMAYFMRAANQYSRALAKLLPEFMDSERMCLDWDFSQDEEWKILKSHVDTERMRATRVRDRQWSTPLTPGHRMYFDVEVDVTPLTLLHAYAVLEVEPSISSIATFTGMGDGEVKEWLQTSHVCEPFEEYMSSHRREGLNPITDGADYGERTSHGGKVTAVNPVRSLDTLDFVVRLLEDDDGSHENLRYFSSRSRWTHADYAGRFLVALVLNDAWSHTRKLGDADVVPVAYRVMIALKVLQYLVSGRQWTGGFARPHDN